MKEIIKRDGTKVPFDKCKIKLAIIKAFIDVNGKETEGAEKTAEMIADEINLLTSSSEPTDIESVQDMVVKLLMSTDCKDVAERYVQYRYKRSLIREYNTTDKTIFELLGGTSDYWNNENSNKNPKTATVMRDYIAGITSTDITNRFLLPKEISKAHNEGAIHFHDADYFIQPITNCCLINLDDMLQNGTVINGVMIEKPHRFITAATIATQIITSVTSSQYGGATISLTHLTPFIRTSREIIYKKNKETFSHFTNFCDDMTKEEQENFLNKITDKELKKEIADGVQTFNYQINSMSTTNGQAPFLSVFMYLGETEDYKDELAMLIEEFLHQRILGMKNETGVYITQAFPKLLYVLEEDNITENSKYWYLTKLAAECTAKRLVPDYISEKIMKRDKIDDHGNGQCYPCMGCRSFLTTYIDKNNKPKYYGRFNSGVVTINLPYIAMLSEGNYDIFWQEFEKYTELCHKALQIRHKHLRGVTSDTAPIMWQYGALARLEKGEKIDKLLLDNYSTLSLGYAGLYECVKYMTGNSHTDKDKGEEFAFKVMTALNDKCKKWRAEETIAYSLYGTPIESTTYKFAKCNRAKFGLIEGITDRDYITNSYHQTKVAAYSDVWLIKSCEPVNAGCSLI